MQTIDLSMAVSQLSRQEFVKIIHDKIGAEPIYVGESVIQAKFPNNKDIIEYQVYHRLNKEDIIDIRFIKYPDRIIHITTINELFELIDTAKCSNNSTFESYTKSNSCNEFWR